MAPVSAQSIGPSLITANSSIVAVLPIGASLAISFIDLNGTILAPVPVVLETDLHAVQQELQAKITRLELLFQSYNSSLWNAVAAANMHINKSIPDSPISVNSSCICAMAAPHNESGFNAKLHYGALGDGRADDTIAIQSAITAAAAVGGTVYLPAGMYYTTDTLNVSGGVLLYGDGLGSSPTTISMKGTVIQYRGLGY